MTTFVIGDTQGCHLNVLQLLERIENISPGARIWFIGDILNRGPQSLAGLRHIMAMGARANSVMGNHDLHLLAVAAGIRKAHRSDTLDEILQAPDRADLLDWVRHRPLAHFQDGHLLVHAGVLPQWTAQQVLAHAREVEAVLRGPHWIDFLHSMYGNTPARWDDGLQGADRLRCIINALTRIRFCSADGVMDFGHHVAPQTAPDGLMPWFEVPGRRTQDVTMVIGHWSTLGLVLQPNLIALDTGCLWGGKLSAVCLEDRTLVQVACPQYLQPGSK